MALPIQSTPTYRTVLPVSGQDIEYRPFLVKEQNILVQRRCRRKTDYAIC